LLYDPQLSVEEHFPKQSKSLFMAAETENPHFNTKQRQLVASL
jgi:hypothetical protein